MKWNDISEWQPGERRNSPNRLHIEGQLCRLVIGHDRRFGIWWTSIGASARLVLAAQTVEEAKREAITRMQERLEKMLSEVHQMKDAS
jgi:hypothetical protein